MARIIAKMTTIFPDAPETVLANLLRDLGARIKEARLRREINAETLAASSGTTRVTLRKIERGNDGVSIGMYLRVLHALGLHDDMRQVAASDPVGRAMQAERIKTPIRAPKRVSREGRDSRGPSSEIRTETDTNDARQD